MTTPNRKPTFLQSVVKGFAEFSDRVVVGGLKEEMKRHALNLVEQAAEEMVLAELGPKAWGKMKDEEREVWAKRAQIAMSTLLSTAAHNFRRRKRS